MHITLHLGAHRTAHKSLHARLAANAEALAAADVTFWGEAERRSGLYAGLFGVPDRAEARALLEGERSLDILRTLLDVLEDDGVGRLLVSEPHMIGGLPDMVRRKTLYPFLSERLGRFVPAFHDRCDRVVLTIRDLESFWRSTVAALVQRGAPMPGRRGFSKLARQSMTWRRVIEEIATALPDATLIVVPYESMGGRWDAMMPLLGAPDCPAPPQGRGRDRLARSPGPWKLRKLLDERGAEPRKLMVSENGIWLPFEADDSAAMADAYAEDLAWLRSGASGCATFIDSAAAAESCAMDRTRGPTADDRGPFAQNAQRLGNAG